MPRWGDESRTSAWGRAFWRLAAAGLAAVALCGPAVARAQDANEPQQDTAEQRDTSAGTPAASVAQQLFLEGRDAYDRGDFSTAEQLFRQSHKLEPAPGTLLNLALSEEKVGKLSDAWQHAREVVDALPADDSRGPIARALHDDLDGRVPRLQLTLDEHAPADAVVELDGILLEGVMLGTAIPLNPGSHDIVVRAPGWRVRHIAIEIEEGQRVARVVMVGAKVPPDPPGEGDGDQQGDGSLTGVQAVGITMLAVGGASLVAGLVLGGLVMDRKSTVNDHCDANRVCDDEAFDAAAEGKRLSAASTGTFIAGAALAAAGAIVLIVAPSSDRESRAALSFRARPGGTFATLDVTF